jgi:hypothetical protein
MSSLFPIQEFRDKPSKTHKDANTLRICMHDDCKVKLSRYNLTSYCVLHEKEHPDFKAVI